MENKSSQYVLIGLACLLLGGILLFQLYDIPPLYPQAETSVAAFPGASSQETAAQENATAAYTGPVNLNTATFEELLSLEGIGAVKAQAILDYREEYGGFSDITELMNVSGIGESTFEKNKDRLLV